LARLSLENGRWHLSGDAQVAMVAKRLFPGARSEGPGGASFPATPRVMQDLVWLMQRFPIAAAEGRETELDSAVSSARAHARRRIEAAVQKHAASGARFKGTPRPYQSEGLAFALANQKVLIADDMGLGKTVMAMMLMAAEEVGLPALVVPQPHLVEQWSEMLDAFLEVGGELGLRVAVVSSRGTSKDDVRRGRDKIPDADIIIMHYGLVAYWKERLLDAGIPTVVFDEIGDLRHYGTDKYQACSAVSSAATHVCGLSGTPIYNYGDEIWSIMNAVDFQSLGPRDDFLREWCTAYGAHHPVRDPQALGAWLRREGLMIRRRKADVADQLPPKSRSVEHIDADDGLFRRAMDRAVPLLQQYQGADRWQKFTLSGRIGEDARRATGLAKVDGIAAFLATLLEAGEPVLAAVYHHDVVDALCERLAQWNPVCYTGRESSKEKNASKRGFIESESDLMFVSLRSTQGIDGLQKRARIGVVCELDWSPAIHAQFEDRLWRDGQTEHVLIYYLVSSVGSDPDMQAKLGLKIGQAKGILDDPFESEEDRQRDAEATKGFVSSMIERLAREMAAA
jgi:SNF2 family DNA or RNA helicase